MAPGLMAPGLMGARAAGPISPRPESLRDNQHPKRFLAERATEASIVSSRSSFDPHAYCSKSAPGAVMISMYLHFLIYLSLGYPGSDGTAASGHRVLFTSLFYEGSSGEF